MRRSHRPIVIASRRSPLAQAQAQSVGRVLAAAHPNNAVEYRWIESEGDKLTNAALADAGGKGLFAHAVEQAVQDGQADVAVHSLKDMPANEATPGLVIAAIPSRSDVRDCLISAAAQNLDQLPHGATLGTASPRRAAQAKRVRSDLRIELIRGNVETRIRKVLEEKRYDATLLAVAGLERAGLSQYAKHPINPSVMLPAAGQGALAIQCRSDDHHTLTLCLPLNDAASATAVHAERHVVAALEGDCHSSIAVLVEPYTQERDLCYRLRTRVLSPDGQQCIETDDRTPAKGLSQRVKAITAQLHESGCQQLLQANG